MQGYNVVHPMGFDAFGLPGENAAIKRGIQPYKWTTENIANMRRQMRSMGAEEVARLGRDIEAGELPDDDSLVGPLVRNICHENARQYFSFPV